ncbi:Pyruvate phosphate dikinase, PEP/pyruvate binding domain isoform 1 [Hibiscus syriacus]|uniref:Pyruvate phosphate dikinase, PEP/pyruvate binding domain isoform 1 n=1 Tax=Hibiscus syriacus TaxID=106335 RepID=A0A6A3BQT1_HIBSY|nr:Pyruvate phosphate dikinase, PEP/pyruvate binding domain isoform 1 [Hibiscus syriacus]
MASCCRKISSIVPIFVFFLLVSSPVHAKSQTFRPGKELRKLKTSPDGDVIDCVLLRHQPAFDHARLKGTRPLVPPERPNGHTPKGTMTMNAAEDFQLWRRSGETCPDGTIPIRRTTERDMLRANSVASFGKKPARLFRRDTTNDGHEHAVGYVSGDEYYGAKASINVWAPNVTNQYEFSLSQLWVISGSFGDDLNTIEAGWQACTSCINFVLLKNMMGGTKVAITPFLMQVSPELYGDYYPRFFTYWTSDAYQATGCYNLLCSGFVQTNNKVAIGAAISPTSSYGGGQFDISILVWKDPKHGNWWLEFGSGILVGYWPSFLFTHLRDHASMVQFGGEVVNSSPGGSHTSTEMGSGHFAGEGFGKASYFRNLQVVDWDNNLIPLPNLKVLADHPNCYDIQGGINAAWGNYFYYGGPGRNVKCP